MDTILTYFNNMFLALPVTEEVQRAKDELLAMAQDRYLDLKTEGRTENEAVGTVIEEFGNIGELASELGITPNEENMENRKFLSEGEADSFLCAYTASDGFLGLGIFLLFVSPILLIFLGLLNTGLRPIVSNVVFGCLGVPFLLVFLAVGFCLIIYSAFNRKPWKKMAREHYQMDYQTAMYVEEKYEEQQRYFVLHIMIGVALLVVGIIPLVIMGVQFDAVPPAVRGIAVDAFMVLYGISIYSFIRAGMSQKRFKILRKTGRFAVKERKIRRNK